MLIVALVLVSFQSVLCNAACNGNTSFPEWFKFGAATSAGQTEGAWNVSDKSETIWDRFEQTPGAIVDNSTNWVTADSYHLYQRDAQIAAEMGLDFYRFSIAWSRLLPNGFANETSEDGKNYYNNLIDELLKNNVEPVITIHHNDLPQILQDLGGWANPLITDWFADYARVVFELFGDRVKTWLTINEPLIMCDSYYNSGVPLVKIPDLAAYICVKNSLVAHAKAWRIYDTEFKPKYHGKMSIPHLAFWYEPLTPQDANVTELILQYGVGRYYHPIYSEEGGWPKSLERAIAETSKRQGYPTSKMPAFTPEEVELVKGTYDFCAINHYSSLKVRRASSNDTIGTWPMHGAPDLGAVFSIPDDWLIPSTNSLKFTNHPEGLRQLISWMRQQYGDQEFMISEIGCQATQLGLNDQRRVDYHSGFLNEILLINREDGANITGYTIWSLVDQWAWANGFTNNFGLYEVDLQSPELTRTQRKSGTWLSKVTKQRSLDVDC